MSGTSILDRMAAEQTKVKDAAATKLTPRGAEKGAATPAVNDKALPDTTAAFPNDHPQEVLVKALVDIETQLAYIQQAVDAVRAMIGAVEPPKVDKVVTTKAAEKAADKKAADPEFADRFAQLKKDAEDATFKDGAEDPPEKLFAAGAGPWVCPTHGDAVEATSRRGRPYRKCEKCDEFERLV